MPLEHHGETFFVVKTTFRRSLRIELLAQRGNFAQAVQGFNMSHPTLRCSISSLKEQLGV